VYVVPGSHDFSPSGKTMLDVIENAGLIVNVCKGKVEGDRLKLSFAADDKTGAKITGVLGKKGMLEKNFYKSLDLSHLEKEDGFKIFMFHSPLTELKSEDLSEMDSMPLSFLPKHFDYYAGGHIHEIIETNHEDHKNVIFPGPLFPTNFKELEKIEQGGFFIYDNGSVEYCPIQSCSVFHINIDCNHKHPEEVYNEMTESIQGRYFKETIITIRLEGVLESGRPFDINFRQFYDECYKKSAILVLKNTSALSSKGFEEITISSKTTEEMERVLINEHLGQIDLAGFDKEGEEKLILKLMNALAVEKEEGETRTDFERRILTDAGKVIEAMK